MSSAGPWSTEDPDEVIDLLSIVDEGASGQVWKGMLKESKKLAAVKIIPLTDEVRDELAKETKMLKKCKYKYVTYYYGSYLKNGEVWIIMELCEGGSLHDMMHICTMTFEEEQVRAIAACTLLGLNFLKQNNIIHRDLKAKNILISRAGTVKLADFGVAAETSSVITKRHTVIGSPHWMAPEVIVGEHDWQADIWSLGITLIELVESEPPMADIPPLEVIHKIVQDAPPTFRNSEAWSPKFHSFLKKCLVKDPSKRSSTEELLGHPFVAKYVKYLSDRDHKKSIPILRKIVDDNLPQVDWFREQEQIWRDERIESELAELEKQTADENADEGEKSAANTLYRTTAKPDEEHHEANENLLAAFDAALDSLGVGNDEPEQPEKVSKKKKNSHSEKRKSSSRKSGNRTHSKHSSHKSKSKGQKSEGGKTMVIPLKSEASEKVAPAIQRKRQSYSHKRSTSKAKEQLAASNSEPDPALLEPTVLPKRRSKSKHSSTKSKSAVPVPSPVAPPPEVPAPSFPPESEPAGDNESVADEEVTAAEDDKVAKPAPDPEAVKALQARLQALTAKFDQSISGLNTRLGYAAE